MLKITVNIHENNCTKFHYGHKENIGDIYIHFRWGLRLLNCLYTVYVVVVYYLVSKTTRYD